jgi:hypothetical protein
LEFQDDMPVSNPPFATRLELLFWAWHVTQVCEEELQVKPDEQSELTRHCTQELLLKHFGVLPVHAFGYVQVPPEHEPAEVWHASGRVLQLTSGYVQVPPEHEPAEVWHASGGVLQVTSGYVQFPPEHEPTEVWHASGGVLQVFVGYVHPPELV